MSFATLANHVRQIAQQAQSAFQAALCIYFQETVGFPKAIERVGVILEGVCRYRLLFCSNYKQGNEWEIYLRAQVSTPERVLSSQ